MLRQPFIDSKHQSEKLLGEVSPREQDRDKGIGQESPEMVVTVSTLCGDWQTAGLGRELYSCSDSSPHARCRVLVHVPNTIMMSVSAKHSSKDVILCS